MAQNMAFLTEIKQFDELRARYKEVALELGASQKAEDQMSGALAANAYTDMTRHVYSLHNTKPETTLGAKCETIHFDLKQETSTLETLRDQYGRVAMTMGSCSTPENLAVGAVAASAYTNIARLARSLRNAMPEKAFG